MGSTKINQETELIVTGSIAEDSIKVISRPLLEYFSNLHPQFSLSLLVDSMERFRGGTGANIAYTLALLGEHPILLGSISEKDQPYIEQLHSLGVNTAYLNRSKVETARFDVVTDIDNNQFATFYPGAMQDSEKLTLLPWKNGDVYAIISAHDPVMMHQQVRECQAHGIPYAFDIGQQTNNVADQLIVDGVQGAHLLIANAHEMETLAGKLKVSPEQMRAMVPLAITTLGKEGARIEGSSVPKPILIPAAKVKKVVDPTGAGDAWRAGFFAALKRGLDLESAGCWGAVAASFVVEHKGGQEHFFTMEQFQVRLQKLLSLSQDDLHNHNR